MAKRQVKFELSAVDRTKAAFNSVTKGLKGVGSASASAAKGVAGVGLAATATAGALALVVNKSFEFIDAIGKTATRTGITTSAIQAFHLAARESGTNVEGSTRMVSTFLAPAINHHTEVPQGSIKLPWLRGLVAFSKQRVRGRKHVAIVG